MEEKERYVMFNEELIKDTENNSQDYMSISLAVKRLNQQDKEIKAKEKQINTYAKEIVFLDNKIKFLEQSQKLFAISELNKLHQIFWDTIKTGILRSYVCSIINKQIKELGSGEN